MYGATSPGEPLAIIKNIVIGDQNQLTDVEVPDCGEVAAVFLNEGEHAYAKVRFDQDSIDWFTQNLSSIGDAVTRAAIWRYFWMLVMDKKMSSLKFVEFAENQLPHEQSSKS